MVANHSLMIDPAEPLQSRDLSSVNGGCLSRRVRIKDAVFAAIDEAEGYRATQLAEAAGVTDATLSSMRHQGRDIRMSTLQRLLDAMPTDVYLRFYQNLGAGLAHEALTDQEASPDKIISALLQLCDDQSLIGLVRELGALSKQRHQQGSKVLSIMALLMALMQYCELDDMPELIGKVGKYTSTAINRAAENLSEERR
ncbi:helix-turn-helix domain-containing protein [Leptolyngbya sp. PCC 6406]|uniref:helix-turn-helix domain-containing protein n=1 Tax=Leptolyngbya sp. PCC 6406 TaxID=1173264 RepID=UPI0002ACFFBD|nr:helix-turn-helix transcriptional regulator [Leptolyngbya sp. PCC 6406]